MVLNKADIVPDEREQARIKHRFADAVVVGSALVQKVESAQKVEQGTAQHDKITDDIATLLGEMRVAMDS